MRRVISLSGAAFRGWAALGGFAKIFLCIFVVIVGAIINSEVFSGPIPLLNWFKLEKDHKAPVDYGYGPGKGIGSPRPNLRLGQTPAIPKSLLKTPAPAPANAAAPPASAEAAAIPNGGGAGGFFGPSFPWPIIPLHMALLPDGRVFSYGTDQQGNQGAQLVYDVWDPTLGNGSNAHTVLPNTTPTDIFCSAASLLDASGNLLITGGDVTVGGVRNYSSKDVNIFNPSNNTLTASGQMNHPRWYPSITTLPNGDKLLLGGSASPNVGEPTPEVRSATAGWRTLPGISIEQGQWYYPRGFVGPDGAVYLLQENRKIFRLTTDGAGTMQDTGSLLDSGSHTTYPSTMFLGAQGNPFSVLTVRFGKTVQLVDISQNPPVVTYANSLSYDRIFGNATLLADGTVLASGGSGVFNQLTNVAYQVELYNRLAGTWTLGASAAKPRLYHSATLLLPDGSVLTGGGGAPGPVNELNAEIYYPPYLYLKDGSGNPAPRPTLFSAPSTINLNQNFLLTVGANDTISAINLIRVGSNTHTFDAEQRLIPVTFTQSGTQITATANASNKLAPAGNYLLFVFNSSGVPAVAKIVSVPQTGGSAPTASLSASPTTIASGGSSTLTWSSTNATSCSGTGFTASGTSGSTSVSPTATTTYTLTCSGPGGQATASATVTVTTTSLPDVIVTSLSYATGIFTSVVKNQGTAATPGGVHVGVSYSVDGVYRTWGSVIGPLAAGASVTIGTNGGAYVIPNGTHTITAVADDINRFPESNEANNTLSTTITVGGGGDTTPPSVPTGLSGSAISSSQINLTWTASTDNVGVAGYNIFRNGTQVGTSATNSYNDTGLAPSTTYTYTVSAYDAVPNTSAPSGSISVTTQAGGTLPDVIVTSLSYATGIFTSVVKNQGTAATPGGVYVGVSYSVDGVYRTWGSVIGPLAAGASVTIGTNGGAYAIPNGTHTITAVADDVNRFPESIETNNTLSQTITVP